MPLPLNWLTLMRMQEMKVRIDGLDGDMKELQGTCGRMKEQQRQAGLHLPQTFISCLEILRLAILKALDVFCEFFVQGFWVRESPATSLASIRKSWFSGTRVTILTTCLVECCAHSLNALSTILLISAVLRLHC